MYLVKLLVLCVLVVSVKNSKNADDNNKVHIAVYYESLCIDSERFVRNQLLPQVQSHRDRVKVTLVPFGKAYSITSNRFHCQHGPKECSGNMFQDCALYLMRDHSDLAKVTYVDCELSTASGAYGNYKCIDAVPNLSAAAVDACVRGNLGTHLQKQSEIATFRVQKPLSFVPTITIDGVFNQRLQTLAFRNLNEVISKRTFRNSTLSNILNFL